VVAAGVFEEKQICPTPEGLCGDVVVDQAGKVQPRFARVAKKPVNEDHCGYRVSIVRNPRERAARDLTKIPVIVFGHLKVSPGLRLGLGQLLKQSYHVR
jgi:hypothetical protein